MWHEGVSWRKACDVASAYTKYFIETGEKNPIFWADNCAGQNKNWVLYTALTQVVNADWGPDDVTIRYLEPGHTYMKADSMHGLIGKKMKKNTPEIVSYRELTDLVSTSGPRIIVLNLNVDDVYTFEAGNRARSTKKVQIQLLSNIVEAKFAKHSRLLFYKCEHDS